LRSRRRYNIKNFKRLNVIQAKADPFPTTGRRSNRRLTQRLRSSSVAWAEKPKFLAISPSSRSSKNIFKRAGVSFDEQSGVWKEAFPKLQKFTRGETTALRKLGF